ncbi:MAG: DUF2190 family protein [Alphaproteobacteria bacterium]|nr:DUF2190 family protein [Alphaproteobacteria bacterium]
MKNYIQSGDTLTLSAPYDVTGGGGLKVGSIFAVAAADALTGAEVEGVTKGVFELPKTSALAISIGDKLYWDDAAKEVNKTATGNTLIGVAVTAAANPSATVQVRLNGSF